jgi:gas vesicle protein
MTAKRKNVLFCFVAGGLIGTGLALCYAPSSGREVRNYLEMKSEIVRVKVAEMADRARDKDTFHPT